MTLSDIFLTVARRVDGALLVGQVIGDELGNLPAGRLHVLGVGKVAFPMFDGLLDAVGSERIPGGLLIAPATRFPADARLPNGVVGLAADHPDPSNRSVMAGHATCDWLARLTPSDRLVVLLSGGASAAMALPADGLSLEDKCETSRAVMRAGASIAELNCVRKHLSAIKGGQLAIRTPVPTFVLALSDVLGNDQSVIGGGPFSSDRTTFAEALAIVERLSPSAPAPALEHLRRGAAGAFADTPKPGDSRLRHVAFRLVAGPERVLDEARKAVVGAGLAAEVVWPGTERPVGELAHEFGQRARREAMEPTCRRVLIGNGEPSIVVRGRGRGGRATHLALAVAREIAGLSEVSFLAAGTDDRDGTTDASGAVVDGRTWAQAERAGLDPAGALDRFDSEGPLDALGCLVRGPGTSNLLDLHLLGVGV